MSIARIIRRLGSTPQQRGSTQELSCPDIFELSDGNFAVIGTLVGESDPLLLDLPAGAGVASYERMVIVSRATLLDAKADIPER